MYSCPLPCRLVTTSFSGYAFSARNARGKLSSPGGQPLLVNGSVAGPVVTNAFRVDVLFSYKPTPGTVFFFGYGASLTEPDAFRFQNLTRRSDGFFLKASYLFRA